LTLPEGIIMAAATVSVDEFQALEHKVLQTVELIKKEREGRHAAEAGRAAAETARNVAESDLESAQSQIAALEQRLAAAAQALTEVESLHRERDAVRERVERMLATMDELL
jgi:uncharacterized protein involved in exopolysaccharide biosynthesis